MREIKFRAWYKVEKVMESPMTLKEMIAMVPGPDLNLDDYEIMQFTGLHDKNGTEIYEGDIVRYKCISGNNEWDDIYPIKWDRVWRFGPFYLGLNMPGVCRSDNQPNLEVIGNIYQHPELINRR